MDTIYACSSLSSVQKWTQYLYSCFPVNFVSRTMLSLKQAITSPNNACVNVRNRVYGYLQLPCISTRVSVFNIPPVIRISSLLAYYNPNMIDKIIIIA